VAIKNLIKVKAESGQKEPGILKGRFAKKIKKMLGED